MNKMLDKVPETKVQPVHEGWQAFQGLRNEMDRLLHMYDSDFWRMPENLPELWGGPAWKPMMGRDVTPPMDVVEHDGAYDLKVELPGLGEKDVEVTYADGVLTIKGEKTEETKKEEKGGFLVSERRYGSFRRALRMPEKVDPEKIEAHVEKGVLTVHLPIVPEAVAETKKIEVRAG